MKNLFLFLIAITLIFQSCSSDDDNNDPMVEACETPNNLTSSAITEDSATLSWESPNANLNVQVEYGISGFSLGTGTVIMTSQNSTSVTNLMSDTMYDFYVQAICASDNTSTQSSVASFTTGVVCMTPINLSSSEITADSAILNWESPNDNQAVEVEYGLSGFSPGTGTVVSTSQNSTVIESLLPSTSYDFYVQAVCSSNNLSSQSSVASFTTTEISPYAGTWSGTYVDTTDYGTWTFDISANGDFDSGSFYSNNAGGTFPFTSGTLTSDGYLTVNDEFGGAAEGQITGENIEGTLENSSAGTNGTFAGSRAISPFAGTWSGTYDGDDIGTWTLTFSASGVFVSGSTYSNIADVTFITTSAEVTPEGYVTSTNEIGGTSEGQVIGETVNGTWENGGAGGAVTGSRE